MGFHDSSVSLAMKNWEGEDSTYYEEDGRKDFGCFGQ